MNVTILVFVPSLEDVLTFWVVSNVFAQEVLNLIQVEPIVWMQMNVLMILNAKKDVKIL